MCKSKALFDFLVSSITTVCLILIILKQPKNRTIYPRIVIQERNKATLSESKVDM